MAEHLAAVSEAYRLARRIPALDSVASGRYSCAAVAVVVAAAAITVADSLAP